MVQILSESLPSFHTNLIDCVSKSAEILYIQGTLNKQLYYSKNELLLTKSPY